jgi:hypothetical protein
VVNIGGTWGTTGTTGKGYRSICSAAKWAPIIKAAGTFAD